MSQNDASITNLIIDIMDIRNEPDYIHDLNDWIQQIGIDEVLKKVIYMYSSHLK